MIRFFTDPHLGYRPKSHTTSRSQAAYTAALFERAMGCLSEKHPNYCLGDLFDRYSNPEEVIKQGIALAGRCEAVLEGNHDVKNMQGVTSSLAIVQEVHESVVRNVDPGKPSFDTFEEQGIHITLVPHHYTQEVFAESVLRACITKHGDGTEKRVLCLHCNVGDFFGQDSPDSSALYLTEELEKNVRTAFDLVLVGHQHVPQLKPEKEGLCPLLVLGNTMPLTFGEISDRYVYDLNPRTLELKATCVWKRDDEYLELDVGELLAAEGDIETGCSLVKIVGELPGDQRPLVGRALVTFWKANPDTLLAVNNAVAFQDLSRVRMTSSRPSDIRKSLREAAAAAGVAVQLEELMAELGDAE